MSGLTMLRAFVRPATNGRGATQKCSFKNHIGEATAVYA
jgi:hypothetical protein